MCGIQLTEVFKRNEMPVEADLESIFINKVKVNKKLNSIEILLLSKQIVDERILDRITLLFQEKFDGLKVEVKIKYEVGDEFSKVLDRFWNNILYLIEKDIPSSSSWLDQLKYEIKDNQIIIYPINEIVNFALTTNRLDNKIKTKFKEELDLNVDVIIDNSLIENNGDEIIEKTMEEEKIISIETLYSDKEKDKARSKKTTSNKAYSFGKK